MDQIRIEHTHDPGFDRDLGLEWNRGLDRMEGENVRLVEGVIWAVLFSIPVWVAAIAAMF